MKKVYFQGHEYLADTKYADSICTKSNFDGKSIKIGIADAEHTTL